MPDQPRIPPGPAIAPACPLDSGQLHHTELGDRSALLRSHCRDGLEIQPQRAKLVVAHVPETLPRHLVGERSAIRAYAFTNRMEKIGFGPRADHAARDVRTGPGAARESGTVTAAAGGSNVLAVRESRSGRDRGD